MKLSEAMEAGSKKYPQAVASRLHIVRNLNRSVRAVSSLGAVAYGLGYSGSSQSNALSLIAKTFPQLDEEFPKRVVSDSPVIDGHLNCTLEAEKTLIEVIFNRIQSESTVDTIKWLKENNL